MKAVQEGNVPGAPAYFHGRWIEALAHYDSNTYEFEESDESRRVKDEKKLFDEVRREYKNELRRKGREVSLQLMREEVWRRLQERLGASQPTDVVEIGSASHRRAADLLKEESAEDRPLAEVVAFRKRRSAPLRTDSGSEPA